jgi:hypothetical protein
MPVEIINNTDSIYIPMGGPWQSEEDNTAYNEANRIFHELKESKPYVALVQSHHVYSHGYWIELKEKEVKYPDHILNEHKS